MTVIIGISGYFHDSSVCLVVDGEIVDIKQGMKLDRYKVHDISLVIDNLFVDDDFESEYVKDQKEYDPEGNDTLYLDNVIRRGKSGDWYMKRGYIVGGFQKGTNFEHLVGKFVGNIDNLTKGKCVMKVTDNEKEYI